MVDFKRVLESHTLAELRKIVANMNVANYIKLKAKNHGGKDIKLTKPQLINLMVNHYSGGLHDGKDTINRSQYIPESKGVLGAKLDKEQLLEEIMGMVESGDIDEKDAKLIYNQQLKLLQDEGAIHKGTRKKKEVKPKRKLVIKKTKKKVEEHFEKMNSVLDLIDEMTKPKTTKKEANKMAISQGYEKSSDVVDDFIMEHDIHTEMMEKNPNDIEHNKHFVKVLKKYQELTKTKARRNKLGITEQKGKGIGMMLATSIIPSIIKSIRQKGGGMEEEGEGFVSQGFGRDFLRGAKLGTTLGLKMLPML